ncbi:MAG: metalloregulator ArsR/SmtB family transcription factor [Clostridia bacterium]
MRMDQSVEGCAYLAVHEDVVGKVLEQMPSGETLYELADLFKVFGDATRVKILYALFEAELCVCDLAQLLGLTQTAVSHQLRVLKGAKLVKFRRDGKMAFYALADEHVRLILGQGMAHVTEDEARNG